MQCSGTVMPTINMAHLAMLDCLGSRMPCCHSMILCGVPWSQTLEMLSSRDKDRSSFEPDDDFGTCHCAMRPSTTAGSGCSQEKEGPPLAVASSSGGEGESKAGRKGLADG